MTRLIGRRGTRAGPGAILLAGLVAVTGCALSGCPGKTDDGGVDAAGTAGDDATSQPETHAGGGSEATVADAGESGTAIDAHDTGSTIDAGDASIAADADAAAGDAAPPFEASCTGEVAVEDTDLAQCSTCAYSEDCPAGMPLGACCTWLAAPADALADGTGLHRYSTSVTTATPDLSCLVQPGSPGTPQLVTLTGYVWAFSSGSDTAGVRVEVYAENHPETPDGTFGATPLGTYATSASDPVDPIDTTWDSKCPNGCSFRQYTIAGIPTETPLVLVTSDGGGSSAWVTRYEYGVYLASADVQGGVAHYDATAMAGPDVETIAGSVGLSVNAGTGQLIGEVHDCSGIRLSGATVDVDIQHFFAIDYFADDESDPLPSFQLTDTSPIGMFSALNVQTGVPVRVTAVGACPPGAASATPPVCDLGAYATLGTYVVQMFPGAVTAVALRGRRPWQL